MRRFGVGVLLVSTLCTWAAAQHDHVQIAQQNMPAVVAVNVMKKDGSTFSGTGFLLSQDGLLATNLHVLEDSIYANITFNNGATSGEALLVGQQELTDLALLKINARHLPYVHLGDSDKVLPGQTITVIGNPRRLQNTVTSGIISQIRPQNNGILWHQISAPISPNSSGSPIFNEQGEVISIAFSSLLGENNQNLNFAIPINYLKQLLTSQGWEIPQATAQTSSGNSFVKHLQKSWEILKQLLKKWFPSWGKTKTN